jgi:DNA-binding response OmpR family regulator
MDGMKRLRGIIFPLRRKNMGHLSKRILVVDDDQGILDCFEVLLGDRYDVVKTNNGYEALRILEDDPPPLMFLDIVMPGLNGIDILKKLRKDQKKVGVVVITATSQEEIEKEAKSFGVVDYLKKPFDIAEVEKIASNVFS